MSQMTRSRLLAAVFAMAVIPGIATAITWTESVQPDPLAPGATCAVHEPMSSGSYIYQYPSKYDQIFWPLTDEKAIWFCPTSGFISFMMDFEKVTSNELRDITVYLRANYMTGRALDLRGRLALLEATYALRETDSRFRIRLLRALAYYHERNLDNAAAARSYRRKALAAIRDELGKDLEHGLRLEYQFVAAAYEREFGNNAQSDRDLKALDADMAKTSDPELKGYVEYLTKLKDDIPRIKPGGFLAPTADRSD